MPSGAERSATRAWIRKGLMSAPAPSVRGVVAVSVWGSVVMSMRLLVDLWDRWSCRCGSLSVRSASVDRERRAEYRPVDQAGELKSLLECRTEPAVVEEAPVLEALGDRGDIGALAPLRPGARVRLGGEEVDVAAE